MQIRPSFPGVNRPQWVNKPVQFAARSKVRPVAWTPDEKAVQDFHTLKRMILRPFLLLAAGFALAGGVVMLYGPPGVKATLQTVETSR